MVSFLGLILLLVLFFWIASISNRLARLERKLSRSQSVPSLVPVQASAAATTPLPSAAEPHWPAKATRPQTLPSETSRQERPEDSALASGLLTKIGVLAVILGMAFFVKYAIDQGWLNEWTRVILGLAAGFLLCVLGNLWKEKYAQYAAALTGGGIALMYFSVFAAYQFYHLVPQIVALVCMVAVSMIGLWFAYERKSVGLAGLAVMGAYLSPVVLHSGTDQHTALFTYLGLMNVVAVGALFIYFSNELLFVSFLGTVFDLFLWGLTYLNRDNSPATAGFAAFTFLLLLVGGAAALRTSHKSKRLPERSDYYFGLLSVLSGIFYVVLLYSTLYHYYHGYLALMGLIGSVGAFFAYALVDRLELKNVNYALAFVGTGLLALACIWRFADKTTDFVLIAAGLLLVAGGVVLKRAELRVWGFLTLVACIFAVLFTPYDKEYMFIFNSKFGLTLAEVAALWATGWLYSLVEVSDQEKQASEAAHVLGSLVLWFGFSWELVYYFRSAASVNTRNLLLSLWWIGYATVLVLWGAAVKSGIYKKIALGLFLLAIAKVFLYDSLTLETAYRIIAFIALGVILLMVSYSYQHNKERITEFLSDANPPRT